MAWEDRTPEEKKKAQTEARRYKASDDNHTYVVTTAKGARLTAKGINRSGVMTTVAIAEHIHHTRRVYANQKRLIGLQQEYDAASEAVNRAAIAEQAAFVIEHQIEHFAESWLARALTLLPLDQMRESRVDWLARAEQAWAEAAADRG